MKYGSFIGIGPGFESFSDYDWLTLNVTSVLGKVVALLSTGQFKNGTALPGNGTIAMWNVEAGTLDGIPSTQGPIIAADLDQGDVIPPPNTYAVTEQRTYLGVTRTVNILSATIYTQRYNTTPTYIYDKASGMLLEASLQTVVQSESQPITSEYSYSIIETNIFGSASTPKPIQSGTPTASPTLQPSASATPSPTSTGPPNQNVATEYIVLGAVAVIIAIIVAALVLRKKH